MAPRSVPLRTTSTLTEAELEEYRRLGIVRLGRVADDSVMDALCERIDEIMLGTTSYQGMRKQLCPSAGNGANPSSLKYRKIEDLEMDPLFREYLTGPLFRDITRRLIGEQVSVFRSMFFNKPAEGGEPLMWHNDGRGWGLSIKEQFSIYTALDAATLDNGCMQMMPGSHLTPHPQGLETPEQIQQFAPEDKRLTMELAKGEVLLFHINVLHASGDNHTTSPRRAFSVAYVDGNAWRAETGHLLPLVMPSYIPTEQRNARFANTA